VGGDSRFCAGQKGRKGNRDPYRGGPDFGLLGFKTHSIYAEVADETEVFFEDDVLSDVLSKNELKIDYIHPNEKGYKIIVDAFVKHLKII